MQTYQVPKFLVDNIFDMKIQLCTYLQLERSKAKQCEDRRLLTYILSQSPGGPQEDTFQAHGKAEKQDQNVL